MRERTTARPVDYGLLASGAMLIAAVVLLVLQRAPGVAWPLLVCGLALLSTVVGNRGRGSR